MEDKIYIDAPYKDRKEVSELGGKWDNTTKHWYYTNPEEKEKFSKWNIIEQEVLDISILGYYKDTLDKEYIHFFEKGTEKITDGETIYDFDMAKDILSHSEKVDNIAIQDMVSKLKSNIIFSNPPLNQLVSFIQPRIYIDVPYQDRKEVSELGAKWDSTAKRWYYLNSNESDKFSKWNIIDIANTTNTITSLTKQLEDGVRNVFESDKFKKYLYTASKFYNYSFRNQLLISIQNEYATHVKGYSSWKKDFGMTVKKGERGIQIIAPLKYHKKPEDIINELHKNGMFQIGSYQLEKTVSNTFNIFTHGSTLVNLNREQFKEELIKIINSNNLIGFQPVYVYDISQVHPEMILDELGTAIPNPKSQLLNLNPIGKVNKENSELTLNLFHAFHNICKVPIKEEKIEKHGVKGYFSRKTMDITLEESLDLYDKTACLIHEIIHCRLHDTQEKISTKTRSTKEVEAESVAFIVSKYYGFDTKEWSFSYIATWSKDKELKELEFSLKVIQQESQKIISELDIEMQKLQEKAETLQEQEDKFIETMLVPDSLEKIGSAETKVLAETENQETYNMFKKLYNENRLTALSELYKYGDKQFQSLTQTELKILANSSISDHFIYNSLENYKPINLNTLYKIAQKQKTIESSILVEVISCEDLCDKKFFKNEEIISFNDANKRMTEYETFVQSFKTHSESYFPDIRCELNVICIDTNAEPSVISSKLQVNIGDGKQNNLIDSIKKSNFLKNLQKKHSHCKSGMAAKQFINMLEKSVSKEHTSQKQIIGSR